MKLTIKLSDQRQCLLDISADIPFSDQPFGIYGKSGGGKTTLLRCIAGLEKNAICNIDWLPEYEKKPKVGMVFQDPALFPHLNVQQNLLFSKSLSDTADFSIGQVCDWFGIQYLLTSEVAKLSGGEQQRVALARAIINKPDLLLLDEPVSALDKSSRSKILSILKSISQEHGIPMIMVSHSLREMAYFTGNMLVLEKGSVSRQGNTLDMVNQLCAYQPSTVFSILECSQTKVMSDFDMVRLSCDDQTLFAHSYSEHQGKIWVKIEANQVSLSVQPAVESSIVNHLCCHIDKISPMAEGKVLIRLKLNQQVLHAEISDWSSQKLGLEEGQRVFAQFKLP